jgi:hypothetical protein
MGQQLVCDADENLADVLLLTDGEVSPQLMGGNQGVVLVRRGRAGRMGSHRC